MTYDEIRAMPTDVPRDYFDTRDCLAMHESCLRSYHILAKVKELLARDTSLEVIAELIDMMERPFPCPAERKCS